MTSTIMPDCFSDVFEYSYTVADSDIDEMGHANNLQYLRWTLKAASAHSKHVGWSSSRYKEEGHGFIVRSHSIKYRIPALLNDEVLVKTWVASMEKVSSIRKYHIVRVSDGRRLAEAETNWVFVSLADGGLRKIPQKVIDSFRVGN